MTWLVGLDGISFYKSLELMDVGLGLDGVEKERAQWEIHFFNDFLYFVGTLSFFIALNWFDIIDFQMNNIGTVRRKCIYFEVTTT